MSAAGLLRQVEAAGGRLIPRGGDRLGVEAPKPLSDELIAALREHKDEVLELLGAANPDTRPDGIPVEWARGLIRLRSMARPADIEPERWRMVLTDAAAFLERFGAQAAALGWTTGEVWGAHRSAPLQRLEAGGLVLFLQGREIVAMAEDKATVRTTDDKSLSFYRRTVDPREQRLVWEDAA